MNGSTVTVPGTFTYTSAAGTVLGAGNGQTQAVTFTPTDTTDYTTASSTATDQRPQATPTVVRSNPVNIATARPWPMAAGRELDLNGSTVTVPGTFTYTPAAGTISGAGNGQSAAVTFTPTDTTDYTTASSTATDQRPQATPTVSCVQSGQHRRTARPWPMAAQRGANWTVTAAPSRCPGPSPTRRPPEPCCRHGPGPDARRSPSPPPTRPTTPRPRRP